MNNSDERKRDSFMTIGRCAVNGKKQYVSKSAAKRSLKATNKRRDVTRGTKREVDIYLCRSCGHWHTSSHTY